MPGALSFSGRRAPPALPRLALACIALFTLGACAATDHRESRGAGGDRFAPCPVAPNCAISQADAGGDRVDPLRAGRDARSAHARLLAVLGADSAYRILEDDDRYVHAEYTSARMRYRDDVEFLIRDDGRIDVRSASRIGWYDWGANRRRIETLRDALNAR